MWNRSRVARRHFVGKAGRLVNNCSLGDVADDCRMAMGHLKGTSQL